MCIHWLQSGEYDVHGWLYSSSYQVAILRFETLKKPFINHNIFFLNWSQQNKCNGFSLKIAHVMFWSQRTHARPLNAPTHKTILQRALIRSNNCYRVWSVWQAACTREHMSCDSESVTVKLLLHVCVYLNNSISLNVLIITGLAAKDPAWHMNRKYWHTKSI